MENEEKVLIAQKCQSIGDLRELHGKNQEIHQLRIMHSPDLISMAGIESFRNLTHLTLSQNNIDKIEGLQNAINLQSLNLAGNRIRIIQGVQNLKKLRNLNLSYNKITQLTPLQIFRGEEYSLQVLDLRCNMISDLKELASFSGIKTMVEIMLDSTKKPNPICVNKQAYYRTIVQLQNCNNLRLIDKQSFDDIQQQVFLKQHIIDEKPMISPKKENVRILSQPQTVKQETIMKNNSILTENLFNIQNQWIEKETEYRAQIIQLQNKNDDLLQSQKELVNKYECNEQYWNGKCGALQQELIDLQVEISNLRRENKSLRFDLSETQAQVQEKSKEQKNLLEKKQKKDDMIDVLQSRINEQMQENGRIIKQNQNLSEENVKVKAEMTEKLKIIQDLKSRLKEQDHQLQQFHQKAIEQAQTYLYKQDEVQTKYQSINEENKQLMQENLKLNDRIQDLIELVKDWELKYDSSLKENELNMQQLNERMRKQYDAKIFEIQSYYQKQKEDVETESKRLQDQLEEEVRKVLLDSIDKNKQLKYQYDEKIRQEIELKQILKQNILKCQDQEGIIQELQAVLMKIRKEVSEYLNQKDQITKDFETKKNEFQRDIAKLTSERDILQQQLQLLERDHKQLKEENESNQENLEKYRTKSKFTQQLEAQLDEIQTTLTVKNKMLDDKNETIDDLKQQLESAKQSEQVAQEDYSRLLRRYERQNQIIEELEGQMNSLQDEYDNKQQELKDKKQLILVFEKELEGIREKQEVDIQQMKQEIYEKDHNIMELLKLVEDARESLKKREEKLKEKTTQSNYLEKKLQEIDSQYEKHLSEKEKEITYLRKRLEDTQDEMKNAIQEAQREKKIAKENIEKLHKLFNS